MAEAQQWERAEAVWAEAELLIRVGEKNPMRAWALRTMADTLIEVQQWTWAETVIKMIEEDDQRAWALNILAEALANAEQWERAETHMDTIRACNQKNNRERCASQSLTRFGRNVG